MQIVIIFYRFLNKVIKLIKIFSLKLFKIEINIVLKTINFNNYHYILINFIYYILIINIKINYFNIIAIVKKDF